MKLNVLLVAALVAAVSAVESASSQLTAPKNLRLVTNERSPRGPAVDPDFDPAPNGRHPYFEALIARADLFRKFSLRSQAQLDFYSTKSAGSAAITYTYPADPDPRRQDAAKVVVPPGVNSIPNQVRVPIEISDGSVLVTWDAWFGREWVFTNTNIANYKTFQFASPKDAIWCEVRNRFSLVAPPAIAAVESRGYIGGSRTYEQSFGPNVTRELPLSPMAGEFIIQPETWTRYWAVFERTADWDLYSLWVADENVGPVQIHDRLQLKFRDNILGAFWLEYNSSANTTRNDALVSYARNIVMLRNVTNPAGIFARPTR